MTTPTSSVKQTRRAPRGRSAVNGQPKLAAANREASQKIRETLTEMKAEVEAFLAELG